MKKLLVLFIALVCTFVVSAQSTTCKQRLIVATDLGGADPDDTQSLIHLLVCSDVVDVEGIISSSSWIDCPDWTAEIIKVIDGYSMVLPMLSKHSDGFPDADYLKSVVKRGQSVSNMAGVGQGKDSPGSELIISAVDKQNDPRPVWLVAWSGMNTIAQAIWKVHESRTSEEFKRFVAKIRIYDVLGQDDAGAWIAKHFPEILYIRNTQVYGCGPSDEWMVYYEPGSYKGTVSLNSDNKGKCKVIIPNDARDRDFHVILVLTDSGEPSLTAYRRFVIDVK